MKLRARPPVFTADPRSPGVARVARPRPATTPCSSSDHLFPPGGPDRPSLEPYTLLAAIAAAAAPASVSGCSSRGRGSVRSGMLAKQASALGHRHRRPRRARARARATRRPRRARRRSGWIIRRSRSARPLLEETVLALRALFAGEAVARRAADPRARRSAAAPGRRRSGSAARRRPRSASPPGRPTGGTAGGCDAETFVARAADLARLTADAGRDPAEVPPTWGGIVLARPGREGARHARGGARGQRSRHGYLAGNRWTTSAGCVTGSRSLATTWLVALAAGPADRLGLLAATLRA